MKKIATTADTSEDGGVFLTSGQIGTPVIEVDGFPVVVHGAEFYCEEHGFTVLTNFDAWSDKDKFTIEGKYVGIDEYSKFACGSQLLVSPLRTLEISALLA
jgi:uncharacterized Zn-binding protein involved in type VI secretion